MGKERHFKTKAKFNEVLAEGGIAHVDVCYIKDTHEIYTHGEFYGKGYYSNAVLFGGNYNTANTPYLKNTMVRFNGHLFISLIETSEAPYPLFADNSMNRFLYADDGYVIANYEQSSDWILLI